LDLLQKNGLALLAVFLISSMFASRPVFSEASPKISAQDYEQKARAYFEKTGASQEIHIVDLRIQTL